MPMRQEAPGGALDWRPAPPPSPIVLEGAHVRVEPLEPARHGKDLYAAQAASDAALWDYMSVGPFKDEASFASWLEQIEGSRDPLFFAIVDRLSGRALGMASYMRMAPGHGVIEIGNIWFGPALQRTKQATEAIYLLARHVFDDLGYRRLEWKCNDLNDASKRAALRFGFAPEGLFRRHMVIKGRNRDTAWFAMLDRDWPAVRRAFETWLVPDNFDANGRQRRSLEEVRRALASFGG